MLSYLQMPDIFQQAIVFVFVELSFNTCIIHSLEQTPLSGTSGSKGTHFKNQFRFFLEN